MSSMSTVQGHLTSRAIGGERGGGGERERETEG